MVPAFDLTARVDRVAAAFSVAWLESIAARPDNRAGIVLHRSGPLVAPVTATLPNVDFLNRIAGVTPETVDHLSAALEFYRGTGVRPWFEIAPHPDFGKMATALTDAGASQIDVYAAVAGESIPSARAAFVRAIDPDEIDTWARLRTEGHGAPPDAADSVVGWPTIEGCRLYVAEPAGQPVAVAALFIHDGVGYLADGATLPSARGRGLQTALIHARVADARAAGCDLVASLAAFGSTSHRNLVRAGLPTAHLLSVWRMRAALE